LMLGECGKIYRTSYLTLGTDRNIHYLIWFNFFRFASV
jgi:hypothetical protein